MHRGDESMGTSLTSPSYSGVPSPDTETETSGSYLKSYSRPLLKYFFFIIIKLLPISKKSPLPVTLLSSLVFSFLSQLLFRRIFLSFITK